VKPIKQLELGGFETEEIKINPEDIIDVSKCAILFGEGGQRIKDLNRTSEFLLSIPKDKYTLYKTGAEHMLPAYKDRNDFPYVINNYTKHILKTQFSRSVYPSFTISNDNIKKTIYCHRLFAMAFIINSSPNITYNVDHINEDKLDYSIQNLTWVSTSQNATDIKNTADKKQSKFKIYTSENYI